MSNVMPLELTPTQSRLFYEALLSSYISFEKLRNMIFVELDEPLDDIPTGIGKKDGVVEVIKWARAEGKLRELSDALIKDRPGNSDVIAYRDSIGGVARRPALAPTNFEFVAPASTWSGKASGLEALVQEDNRLVRADRWAIAMKQAQSRICRIEISSGGPVGTGFLVGNDLILTNCHVYRGIEHKSAVARFDFSSPDAAGVLYTINQGSVAVSTEDLLDFALLRLSSTVEPERGRFAPKDHRFEIDQIQLILQHAKGDPLQIGIGRVTAVLPRPERVVYSTNTEPGSSGSPVFTANWELVAIHHFGDPRNNIGIPIAPIWKLLAADGQV
jgi:Trypsin-like peptidase domain/Effector-associated domain 1